MAQLEPRVALPSQLLSLQHPQKHPSPDNPTHSQAYFNPRALGSHVSLSHNYLTYFRKMVLFLTCIYNHPSFCSKKSKHLKNCFLPPLVVRCTVWQTEFRCENIEIYINRYMHNISA